MQTIASFFLLNVLIVTHAVMIDVALANENESWHNLCTEYIVDRKSNIGHSYLSPDGGWISLYIEDKPLHDCESVMLPVDSGQVKWARLINEQMASQIYRTVTLQGLETPQGIRVSEVIVSTPNIAVPDKVTLNPIPLNQELLSQIQLNEFGIEQRSHYEHRDSSLVLHCKPGQHYSGITMQIPSSRLPEGIKTYFTLDYTATGDFEFSISDALRTATENPLVIKSLQMNRHPLLEHIEIPVEKIDINTEFSFALHCPKGEAQIRLNSLRLEAEVARPHNTRGIWIWEPDAWIKTPEQLIKKVKSVNAKEVYISVPIDHLTWKINHQKELAEFISRVYNDEIAVWAVEGDPHAVIRDKRDTFKHRAKALKKYNEEVVESSRLRGIQYDIEPYLLPGYMLNESRWIEAYIQTITELSQNSRLDIDIVIPFWWSSQQIKGEYFLNQLVPYIKRVTVMNYRTDSDQLRKFAEPFLVWGEINKRKVRIALELGQIADEQRWHYHRSGMGELWLLYIKHQPLLLLTKIPYVNPHGEQLKLIRKSIASGKHTSFYGDADRLLNLLPVLDANWSSYPVYDGLSIHGL